MGVECMWTIDTRAVQHRAVSPADSANALLEQAINQLGFSARAYDKVLRVARTLADLDASESIADNHVSEAIQYRSLDRQMF